MGSLSITSSRRCAVHDRVRETASLPLNCGDGRLIKTASENGSHLRFGNGHITPPASAHRRAPRPAPRGAGCRSGALFHRSARAEHRACLGRCTLSRHRGRHDSPESIVGDRAIGHDFHASNRVDGHDTRDVGAQPNQTRSPVGPTSVVMCKTKTTTNIKKTSPINQTDGDLARPDPPAQEPEPREQDPRARSAHRPASRSTALRGRPPRRVGGSPTTSSEPSLRLFGPCRLPRAQPRRRA